MWGPESRAKALEILNTLYGDAQGGGVLARIEAETARHRPALNRQRRHGLTERDTVLITYGNTLTAPGMQPLATLAEFLDSWVGDAVGLVHLLPIFPYSSDDGFSVIDYRQIDPALGDWSDVARVGEHYGLVLDLVLNHCSRSHAWFQGYLRGDAKTRDYFIEADPNDPRLTLVTRPRSSPLLTPVDVHEGGRYWVWTTFSADQVDLNFANPDVLLEMIDLLLFYATQGARIIRLDAVAYLWKELGTACISLEQTHAVVRLLRLVMDTAAPGVQLLTETNVPQSENLSYFGNGDEANLIYQFSLPPLLLHALVCGRTHALTEWASTLPGPPPRATYLNFTASHDGVGLRPLEGLIDDEERDELLRRMRERGGYVSTRSMPDGRDAPYELNISYYSAMDAGDGEDAHMARFLLAQTVALSLRGVPALYIHILLATPNDTAGVERSGHTRAINRRRWDYGELQTLLARPDTPQGIALREMVRRLRIRGRLPQFHPDAAQQILDLEEGLFGLLRTSHEGQPLIALFNFTSETRTVKLPKAVTELAEEWIDALSDQEISLARKGTEVPSYACLWLMPEAHAEF
ncbi:MAG: sugar phosphorylase [Gammaproteobacteria bacterium]